MQAKVTSTKRKTSWSQRIAWAKRRVPPRFTEGDKNLAGDWTTCACGEQDEELLMEHATYGGCIGPWDRKLMNYGITFTNAVERNRIPTAERALARIQKRSAQLLDQLAKDAQAGSAYAKTA